MSYIEAKDLITKLEIKLDVKMEYLRAVNILDVFADILDKHRSDFEATQHYSPSMATNSISKSVKSIPVEIDGFLDDIFEQINSA